MSCYLEIEISFVLNISLRDHYRFYVLHGLYKHVLMRYNLSLEFYLPSVVEFARAGKRKAAGAGSTHREAGEVVARHSLSHLRDGTRKLGDGR